MNIAKIYRIFLLLFIIHRIHRKLLLIMQHFIFFLLIAQILAEIEAIDQIVNGKFTNPGMSPGQISIYYSQGIEGWSCLGYCEVQNCTLIQPFYPQVNQTSLDCSGYVIQTNSAYINQEITQTINLKVNNYWLSMDYIYPPQDAHLKQLQIIFNEVIIFSLTPTTATSIERYQFSKKIQAKDGPNILTIKMNGLNDGFGFKIANISLHRETNSLLQRIINNLFQLQFLRHSKYLPGGRIFLFSLLSFLVNFDRLEFYLYHNRQYSTNSKNLLEKIKQLQSVKNHFIESKMKEYFPSFVNLLGRVFKQDERKKEYINYKIENQEQKHQTLLDNIEYSLTFFVPIVIIIFLFFHISFRILRRWSVSLIFRPYAFYATLTFALLEGNIQPLSFYSFKELQTLFSFSFQHKLQNLLSIGILFFVFFFCFGLYLWLKFYYQKKVKIIINAQKSTFPSVLSTEYDRGMIIFILGATHQLLLPFPTVQIFTLIIIELIWIMKKIISRAYFPNSLFFFIAFVESLLRIYLQITCLLYSSFQKIRLDINNQYHFYLIFGFIAVIVLNFVCNAIFIIVNFIVSRIFRKNGIRSNNQILKQQLHHKQINITFNLITKSIKNGFQSQNKQKLRKEKDSKQTLGNILIKQIFQNKNKGKSDKKHIRRLKRFILRTNKKVRFGFQVSTI